MAAIEMVRTASNADVTNTQAPVSNNGFHTEKPTSPVVPPTIREESILLREEQRKEALETLLNADGFFKAITDLPFTTPTPQTVEAALISLRLGRGWGRYEGSSYSHFESLRPYAQPEIINALSVLNRPGKTMEDLKTETQPLQRERITELFNEENQEYEKMIASMRTSMRRGLYGSAQILAMEIKKLDPADVEAQVVLQQLEAMKERNQAFEATPYGQTLKAELKAVGAKAA